MVYIRGDGNAKLPRVEAMGKVTWMEVPQDKVKDKEKGIFDYMDLTIMTKQGTSKETNEAIKVRIYKVDYTKPEFAMLKKLDEIRGTSKENIKYPIIKFKYYTTDAQAKDDKGEIVYEEVQKEIKGEMKTVLIPKVYKNHKMSAEDCKSIKIEAEDSTPPNWFKVESESK